MAFNFRKFLLHDVKLLTMGQISGALSHPMAIYSHGQAYTLTLVSDRTQQSHKRKSYKRTFHEMD